jgi:hypothetical protein
MGYDTKLIGCGNNRRSIGTGYKKNIGELMHQYKYCIEELL